MPTSSASWSGTFTFGNACAAYRGPAGDNSPHAHVALQVAIGLDGPLTITGSGGQRAKGQALMVRPGARHALQGAASVGLLYFEPQSATGQALMRHMATSDVASAPADLLARIDPGASPADWLAGFADDARPGPLHPRLSAALRRLAENPALPVTAAAEACGVSPSHLRSLARAQLGLPLATWLLWRKLERAARAVADGAGLAEAAIAGGFADQAHYARTVRRMFGVTPGAARAVLE